MSALLLGGRDSHDVDGGEIEDLEIEGQLRQRGLRGTLDGSGGEAEAMEIEGEHAVYSGGQIEILEAEGELGGVYSGGGQVQGEKKQGYLFGDRVRRGEEIVEDQGER